MLRRRRVPRLVSSQGDHEASRRASARRRGGETITRGGRGQGRARAMRGEGSGGARTRRTRRGARRRTRGEGRRLRGGGRRRRRSRRARSETQSHKARGAGIARFRRGVTLRRRRARLLQPAPRGGALRPGISDVRRRRRDAAIRELRSHREIRRGEGPTAVTVEGCGGAVPRARGRGRERRRKTG